MGIEARARGIDHHVEAPAGERRRCHGGQRTARAEAPDERVRLAGRAVGDDHRAWLLRKERQEDAARRTARTQHQHVGIREGHREIHREVVHDPGAVGVVGVPRIALAGERVACTGRFRALARPGGDGERIELERHRDVEAAAALFREPTRDLGKAAERRQQALVAQRFAGGAGKGLVDLR